MENKNELKFKANKKKNNIIKVEKLFIKKNNSKNIELKKNIRNIVINNKQIKIIPIFKKKKRRWPKKNEFSNIFLSEKFVPKYQNSRRVSTIRDNESIN